MDSVDDFEVLPSERQTGGANAGQSDQATSDAVAPENPPAPPAGMQCLVKDYEARYNADGKQVVQEVKPSKDADTGDANRYAMRYYKYYTRDEEVEKVSLEVRSPYIQDALRHVIGSYPGQSFTGQITLTGRAEHSALGCLVQFRRGLGDHRDAATDPLAVEHVSLLVDFVERVFWRDTERYEENLRGAPACVEFGDLWMLLKPGEQLFSGTSCDQAITRIVKYAFNKSTALCPARWVITVKALGHDGTRYGYIHRDLEIVEFEGVGEVASLPCYPLAFHANKYALQKYLFYRGKKYCGLAGIRYQAYAGEALVVGKVAKPSATSGRPRYAYPQEPLSIEGRVMLDSKAFIRERTSEDIKIQEIRHVDSTHITDDDYMMCHFALAGFSFFDKEWCWFYVDLIKDIDFDEGAFDALLLPTRQKRLIRALTSKHTSGSDGFDDLIKGKGKGCIFLLHGEPGIGKTFTAESISDDIKRPLYVMMSGDLGYDVKTVDRRLRKVMSLVTAWNAVLLIDEADVFLEKRSARDLVRNSLVSIFLRTLEYFSGVMFLTTNRIESFDPAFQSRIHLALKYHGLDAEARRKLWELFLRRTPGFRAADWTPEILGELAGSDINGRQIKNSVRTAHALAMAEDQKFGPEQVRDVLETVAQFKAEFAGEANARTHPSSDADESVPLGGADLHHADDSADCNEFET